MVVLKKLNLQKDYLILLANCNTLIDFNIQKIIEKYLKIGNDFSALV